MKRTLFFSTLLLTLASGSFAATPWEDYLETPTPERAAKVQTRSYTGKTTDSEQQELDLILLETQVLARDPAAAALAFRLRGSVPGGSHAEHLSEMLGRLIRIDAALFLKELKRADGAKQGLDSLVAAYGQGFVDRLEAQAYETQKRVAALSAVADPALKDVRDKCLAVLKKR